MFGLVNVMSKGVIRPVTQAKYLDKIQAILSVSSEHDCRKPAKNRRFFKLQYFATECYICSVHCVLYALHVLRKQFLRFPVILNRLKRIGIKKSR